MKNFIHYHKYNRDTVSSQQQAAIFEEGSRGLGRVLGGDVAAADVRELFCGTPAP